FVSAVCRRHWLRLLVGVTGCIYVIAVGIAWRVTAGHGDFGLRNAIQAADGQMLVELAPDDAASRAGLRPGDVVLQLNGTPTSDDPDAYWRVVYKTPRRAGEHASVRRALTAGEAA